MDLRKNGREILSPVLPAESNAPEVARRVSTLPPVGPSGLPMQKRMVLRRISLTTI
jgi:hypothetical protein